MERTGTDLDKPSHTPIEVKLLRRIAEDRDQAAFAELFNKFQKVGYHLAYHITSDRSGAEEAFQEAMFRVWKSASNFRPDGNAKGWILRAVSREALKWLRTRRKLKNDVSINEKCDSVLLEIPVAENSEQKELCNGLKNCLSQLPSSDQKLISLYFVGGLTQKEIGTALSVPQRTVSFKIEEAIKTLRRKLQRAGLHAALPLLTAKGLVCVFELSDSHVTLTPEAMLQQLTEDSISTGASSSPTSRTGTVIIGTIAGVVLLGIALQNSNELSLNKPPVDPDEQSSMNAGRLSPPLDKLNFVDEFDKSMLDPFWSISDNTAKLKPGLGKKNSRLILQVAQEKAPAKIKSHKNPNKLYLLSKKIRRKGVSELFSLTVKGDSPIGEGRLEYGVELISGSGHIIHHVSYQLVGRDNIEDFDIRQTVASNGKKIKSNFGRMRGNAPNVDLWVDLKPKTPESVSWKNPDWVEIVDNPSPDVTYRTDIGSHVTIDETIQVRIFVIAYPGSWIKWPIDRVSIKQ